MNRGFKRKFILYIPLTAPISKVDNLDFIHLHLFSKAFIGARRQTSRFRSFYQEKEHILKRVTQGNLSLILTS
uniref:Histidyl-tRNA synthetase n=1 Tax=Sphingobacterium sp. (strain 21) TaxID=743722 RepID=F4CAT5_SPHS2